MKFDEEFFPSFEGYKKGTMDVDFMITTYLENFYDKHLKTVIPEWEQYEKYASKQVYVAAEFQVMKEELKSLLLL